MTFRQYKLVRIKTFDTPDVQCARLQRNSKHGLTIIDQSIIVCHIMSMQRITITIPDYIYSDLIKLVPARGVSKFAVRALERELASRNKDPVEEFIQLRKKLPHQKRGAILKAINKGRV